MISSFYEFKTGNKSFGIMPFTKDFLGSSLVNSNYGGWFHDPDVTKYNSHGLFPYTSNKMEKFFNSLDDEDKIILAICEVVKDKVKHIGNCSLQNINWINRSSELAIVIGEKDYWRIGLGEKACKCLLEHGFDKLNLNRIWTGTAATNYGMQKIANNIGMIQEGIFLDGIYLNGRYENVYNYSILKNIYDDQKEQK